MPVADARTGDGADSGRNVGPGADPDGVALTSDERRRLERVVAARLGRRGDARALVAAYLAGLQRHALARTAGDGPVPTTLTAERAMLLVEVSRALGRVIEDHEVAALLRVSPAGARALRRTLLATYADDADRLTLAWSLREARRGGRLRAEGVVGTEIVFPDRDRRDAFVAHLQRRGGAVAALLGDAGHPWRVVVGDDLPEDELPPAAPR